MPRRSWPNFSLTGVTGHRIHPTVSRIEIPTVAKMGGGISSSLEPPPIFTKCDTKWEVAPVSQKMPKSAFFFGDTRVHLVTVVTTYWL